MSAMKRSIMTALVLFGGATSVVGGYWAGYQQGLCTLSRWQQQPHPVASKLPKLPDNPESLEVRLSVGDAPP